MDRTIRIACAVILDGSGRMLLVRKRGTEAFIQPGGKIGAGETAEEALGRELREELGCEASIGRWLGRFGAPAVNEPGRRVEAEIFLAELVGRSAASGEIEEIRWVDPGNPGEIVMAPLTRDEVLPLAVGGAGPLPAYRERGEE